MTTNRITPNAQANELPARTEINAEVVANMVTEAPEVLTKNRTSVQKAISAGTALLQEINDAGGMNDALDAKCNTFLVKNRETIKTIKERREPLTQVLHLIIKEFTSLENSLDPSRAENIASHIQAQRDKLARDKAAERARLEKEAAEKRAKDSELIELKSACENTLLRNFNEHLTAEINKLQNIYNSVTIETYEDSMQSLQSFPTSYMYTHFEKITFSLFPKYCTQVEVQNIITNVKAGKYESFSKTFSDAILNLRMDLIDRMPSLRRELFELAERLREEDERIAALKLKDAEAAKAAAEAAAAKRIEEEEIKQQREKEAAEKIAAESAERERMAAAAIESTRQAEHTESMFEQQAAVFSAPVNEAATREGFEITILNSIGWLEIVKFYFENEGMYKQPEELEKKTLNSMKKFCENYAHTKDVKISSKFLQYEPKIKTVALKQKR